MNHCAPWPRGLEGKKLGKPKEETEKKKCRDYPPTLPRTQKGRIQINRH